MDLSQTSETDLVLGHAYDAKWHGKLGAVTRIGETHRGARNVHLLPPLEDTLDRQVTNEEVLRRMSKEQELLYTSSKRANCNITDTYTEMKNTRVSLIYFEGK